MGVFYTSKPFGQSFLKEGSKEYHIHFDIYEDYSFIYTYKSVTSNHFMKDVYRYVIDNFQDKLIEYGNDTRYDEDGVKDYIWVHLNEDTAEKDIANILECLEAQFMSKWRFQRIPKLLTIVQQHLNTHKILAYAVSDFQKRHGVDETQNVLHVLFNHINSLNT